MSRATASVASPMLRGREKTMQKTFQGKIVLITGASRGIGEGIALAFARRGANLVLAARSAEALERVADQVRACGAEALPAICDVTSQESVNALVNAAVDRFGRVDVLVNNAGIARFGGIESPEFEQNVQQTLQASLFGMIRVTKRVLPILRKQKSGTIVNMSSVMGRKAFASFGSYAIVMHAVTAFSDALRQECAGSGVDVSIIHPGLTATDLLRDSDPAQMPPPFRHMTPMSPDYVGNTVAEAVLRRTSRVVLPPMANMLLLGQALSPVLGDAIAYALTVPAIAKILGLSGANTAGWRVRSV